MRVFLDTNVLLDVLAAREPHFEAAARVWTLAEEGRLEGLVSPLSFSNIYYIASKSAGRAQARRMLRSLQGVFRVATCDDQIVRQAVDAEWDDFEDAVQYFSAVHAKADCLVSRNADHFADSEIPVLSPAEFLATQALEEEGSSTGPQ